MEGALPNHPTLVRGRGSLKEGNVLDSLKGARALQEKDARKQKARDQAKLLAPSEKAEKNKREAARKQKARDQKKATEKENADAEAAIEAQRQKERQNEHGSYYETSTELR